MSSLLNLRIPLVCLLTCSLVITGLLTITTPQSHASNNSLTHSFPPSVNESSSEETAPQAETVDEATRARVSEAYKKIPLSFEENRGQVDKEVKYISRGSGYTLFLTPTEAVFTLQRSDGEKISRSPDARRSPVPAQPRSLPTSVLRMKLKGANPTPAISGENEMGVRTNYFRGNDPEKWQTDVARYERVRYAQVYPGVDMIYYGQQQQLEYDFEVAPGADTRRIALEYIGVKRLKIERRTGDLVLKTAGGEVRQHKPVAYQEVGGERREVASRYVMKGKQKVGVEVGEYDRTKRLVIDPILSYSTYLGGNRSDLPLGSEDFGSGIAVDSSGNAYVTGHTASTNFPTRNQLQTYQGENGLADVFVTKLNTNASGTASLLYSTYLGGSEYDYGKAVAIDTSGNVYVTGYSGSFDFPTRGQSQGGRGVFVAKIDTNLSGADSLLYSTIVGGGSGHDIAVDASGYAYVTGFTSGPHFPTVNQYQRNQGNVDAFVVKLDTNLSGAASLLYSTYLGGREDEGGEGIAVDASGNAYVTGTTNSRNFPTLNQYQTYQSEDGFADVFVTKLNTNAPGTASLLYSTYLGGSSEDSGQDIAIDSSGHAYLTGFTYSSDFPTVHQYQTDHDMKDAFVAKLDTNLSGAASLLYSTYLCGSTEDAGTGIAVDASGNVYVTGYTGSPDFPTLNEYLGDRDYIDAFVSKLNPNLSGEASLLYSTYLGGSSDDYGQDIAVDESGHAYVTGYTHSRDFPTFRQYQTFQGRIDAFVTKLKDTTMISGRVTSDGTTGIGGVTLRLSGSLSRAVVTSSTGNYSFLNLPIGGNYTVTPSRDDLTFLPLKRSFTDLQANQTNINFTTRRATVTGKVTLNTATGAGLRGVTMTLTGAAGFSPRTATTSSNGTYTFHNLPTPGNYKIKPSKANYMFSPTQLVLRNVTANQTDANFVATLRTYRISGVVRHGTDGLAGVTISLSSPTPAGFNARTVMTNSTGAYSFTNVPAGRNYTIKPVRSGFTFSPPTQSITNLSHNVPAGASTNFTGTSP